MDYKLFEIVVDYIYSDSIIFCKLVCKDWYKILNNRYLYAKFKIDYSFLTTQNLLDYSYKNLDLITTSKFFIDIIVNGNEEVVKWLHNNNLLSTSNIFKIFLYSNDNLFLYFKNELLKFDIYKRKLTSKKKNGDNIYFIQDNMFHGIKYCNLDRIKIMYNELNIIEKEDLFLIAYYCNNLEIIKWVYKQQDKDISIYSTNEGHNRNGIIYSSSLRNNNLEIANWLKTQVDISLININHYAYEDYNIDTIKWIFNNHTEKFIGEIDETLNSTGFITHVISTIDLETLIWLTNNGCNFDSSTFVNALRNREFNKPNFKMLDWLIRKNCVIPQYIFNYSFESLDFEIIKYCYNLNITIIDTIQCAIDLMLGAVSTGSLEIINWLYNIKEIQKLIGMNKQIFTNNIYMIACNFNNLEIMDWIYSKGVKLTYNAFLGGVLFGDIKTLEWLKNHKCPFNKKIYNKLIESLQNTRVKLTKLNWLHKNNYPFGNYTFKTALKLKKNNKVVNNYNDYKMIIKWLKEHNCPIFTNSLMYLKDKKLTKFLKDIGVSFENLYDISDNIIDDIVDDVISITL